MMKGKEIIYIEVINIVLKEVKNFKVFVNSRRREKVFLYLFNICIPQVVLFYVYISSSS